MQSSALLIGSHQRLIAKNLSCVFLLLRQKNSLSCLLLQVPLIAVPLLKICDNLFGLHHTSNTILITRINHSYYCCSEYIRKPNYSVLFKNRIIFVFVFGRYFQTEYIRIRIRSSFFNRIYSYSYSVYDNIRIIFAFQLT